MFDIGWSELLVIGVVALIVIGPKELPSVLRAIGQWTGKIRRMAGEFQNQFQEALREAEMSDLKKQVDELNDAARGLTTSFDPLEYDSNKWKETPSTPAAPDATPPVAAAAAEGPAALPAESPAVPPEAAAPEISIPEPAPPVSEKDFIESPPSAPAQGTRPA
jgi:sec-independent protein translocase protein TatB